MAVDFLQVLREAGRGGRDRGWWQQVPFLQQVDHSQGFWGAGLETHGSQGRAELSRAQAARLREGRSAIMKNNVDPGRTALSAKCILTNYELVMIKHTIMRWLASSSPAGMAELPDCKAVWRPASQGALEPWHRGRLRCFDNQGGEMGSGPTVDLVVQAVMSRLCVIIKRKQNEQRVWRNSHESKICV